jgi:SSS family transporter
MNSGLILDVCIIAAYCTGIVLLGLYCGRRESSLGDFALGNRSMPWWAVMASIIAAETSAATFLGAPGEGYKARSIAYAQLIAGLIIGRFVVGFIFLKPYYQYQVYTVYDFLAVRFGPRSRNYASALFLVMRTLASGTRLFVPSLVMVLAWQRLAGHSSATPTTLMPYAIAIVGLTILTCIYTALGGIKAVIWTDLVQATLMFSGAMIAIVLLLYHIGGNHWNLADGVRRVDQLVPGMRSHEGYFLLGWEPNIVTAWMKSRHITAMTPWEYVRLILGSDFTLFSAFIGATFGSVAAFGTDQDMVQRMLSAQTWKKSRRSLIMASFMDIPVAAGFALIGVLLVAYYQIDPRFKPQSTADVFGSYILNVMPAGIRGLVLAGVLATAMGSLSAALNALATSATNDWYIPHFAKHKSAEHQVAAARWFTVVFAILMIAVAVGFADVKITDPSVRIIPVVVGIAGLLLGPMLGVFLIGMLTRSRGSDTGNVIAITAGIAGVLFVSGQYVEIAGLLGRPLQLPGCMPVVAWPWFPMVGAVITGVIGVLFAQTERLENVEAISKGEEIIAADGAQMSTDNTGAPRTH